MPHTAKAKQFIDFTASHRIYLYYLPTILDKGPASRHRC